MALMVFSSPLIRAAVPDGPDERVDRSIERGLQFLASRQNDDGSFASRHGRTGGIVGLSGMAFLAKGYLPGEPPYGETLERCPLALVDTPVCHYERLARQR